MQSGTRHLRARLQGEAERWVRAGAGGVGSLGSSPCPRPRGMGGSEPGRAVPEGRGGGGRGAASRRAQRDAGAARPPSRPSNSRGAAQSGGVGPVPEGAFRVHGAGGGTRVGISVGGGVCGVWSLGETRRAGRALPRSCRSDPGLVTVVVELPIG